MQSKCQNWRNADTGPRGAGDWRASSADPVVDPGRDVFEQLCDDPPASGDVDAPAPMIDGPGDLPRGFLGGRNPEGGALGHFCIDKAGLDVGHIKGDLQLPGSQVQTFEIDALKAFGGAVGSGMTVPPDPGDGRDRDEVAMPLPDKIVPAEVDGPEEAVDIDIDGRL